MFTAIASLLHFPLTKYFLSIKFNLLNQMEIIQRSIAQWGFDGVKMLRALQPTEVRQFTRMNSLSSLSFLMLLSYFRWAFLSTDLLLLFVDPLQYMCIVKQFDELKKFLKTQQKSNALGSSRLLILFTLLNFQQKWKALFRFESL